MKREQFQHISGLVDGQDGGTANKLLANINNDPVLRCYWRRCHLIGDAIRKNLAQVTDRKFPEQVMEAIAQEPTISAPSMAKIIHFPAWTKRAAGMAIAASVAILVITLVPSRVMQTQPSDQVAQVSSNLNTAPQVSNPSNNPSMANSAPVILTSPIVNQTTVSVRPTVTAPEINLAVSTPAEDSEIYIPPLYGIDQFVVRHSASASMHNTLPYARIVGYLSEK